MTTHCGKCGAENRQGAKFCKDCAAPILAKCPNCGATNAPASKFCDECGGPLSVATSKSEGPPDSRPSIRVSPDETAANTEVPEGERKTVTALFADIKGSMELMADLDPEEARAIVDPALKLMIDAVHRYDGYIVQSTGDGSSPCSGASRCRHENCDHDDTRTMQPCNLCTPPPPFRKLAAEVSMRHTRLRVKQS